MNPQQRSRRLQAGLAGLGILGALATSFGIGLATHTASADQATSTSDDSSSSSTGSGSSDSSGTSDSSGSGISSGSQSAPQATTRGS